MNLPLQFLNAQLSVIRLLLQDFEFTASLLVCLDDFGIAAYHATTEQSNLTLLIIIVLQPLFQIITTVIKGDKLIHSIGTQQILERIKLAFIQESIVVLALQSFLLTLQVSHHIVILHGIRTETLRFQITKNLGSYLTHLLQGEHPFTFLLQGFFLSDNVIHLVCDSQCKFRKEHVDFQGLHHLLQLGIISL